jgi:hypothetical protein
MPSPSFFFALGEYFPYELPQPLITSTEDHNRDIIPPQPWCKDLKTRELNNWKIPIQTAEQEPPLQRATTTINLNNVPLLP